MLPGCDYVISLIEVAGLRNVAPDYEIPSSTAWTSASATPLGRAASTDAAHRPGLLEILADVERLCPAALVMNYTNPCRP